MTSLIQKHLDKIVVNKTTGCWVWVASVNHAGRARVGYKGKNKYAARVLSGCPDGLQANHTCDNKSCVNPDHIYFGTQKENMLDARIRGFDSTRSSYLKPEDIDYIIENTGKKLQKEIAKDLGCSRETIRRILLERRVHQ